MASCLLQLFIGTVLFIRAAECDVGLLKANLGDSTAEGSGDDDVTFCLNFNSQFHPLPATYDPQTSYAVADFSFQDGCTSSNYTGNLTNKVVAVGRGHCSFADKAMVIDSLGGRAALVVNYANQSSLVQPSGNISTYNAINITVALILHSDFTQLMGLGANVKVWLYSPTRPPFDPNMVVMFLMASLCVITGAFLSATHHHKRKRRGSSDEEEEDEETSLSLGMGIAMSVGLLIFFCASITLLYYFYDYLVYVIIGIFCLAGTNGVFQVVNPLWKKLLTCESRLPLKGVPCMPSPPPTVRSLGLVLMCAGFVAIWVVYRNENFAWVLQDLIGFCFCLYVMRALLLPSLKACSVLLGLLFFYDIFFVFITPFFTSDGESVMVKVATGGGSKTGEQMPMVFRLPYFIPWTMSKCFADKYSLLGYGDVILPGLLLTYNLAFDLKTQNAGPDRCRFLYFTASSFGYVVGLLLTGLALYAMESGQPALLYLVPCTLLTTMVIAVCRKEFCYMWRGHQCPKKNDDIGAGRSIPPNPQCNRQGGGQGEDEEVIVSENQSLIQ